MNDKKIQVLESANEYLDNLKRGVENIFDYIQESKEFEAIELIPQVAEGMQWVDQVLNVTKDILNIDEGLNIVNQYIEEISEALDNEDYILVGDLFNYEILPVLEKIHKKIKDYLAN